MSGDWGRQIRLHELDRGPVKLRLEPDAAERALIAHNLGLESLPALVADVTVRPWLDGAEITAASRRRSSSSALSRSTLSNSPSPARSKCVSCPPAVPTPRPRAATR